MTPDKSLVPTNKVAAGGLTGAAVVVLLYAADKAGLEMDAVVAGAIVNLAMFAASWLKTERSEHAVGTQRPILVDPPATLTVDEPAETTAYQPRRALPKDTQPLG